MEKSRTTLFVRDDVRNHAREFKVNLSEFLNREYVNKYLSLDVKEAKLTYAEQEVARLKAEITQDKERLESLSLELTEHERRYLATVMPRRRAGYDMRAMWAFFNTEYKRKVEFSEFEHLVRLYEQQAEKRAAYAMDQKRRKK